MKKTIFIYVFLFAANIAVCLAQQPVDFELLEKRNDIYYFDGAPYTGAADGITESTDDYMRLHFVDGIANGPFEGFYDEQRTIPKWTVNNVDGKWEGDYLCFYENSAIEFRAGTRNGKLHGLRECFREDGSLWHTHRYKKGTEHGMRTTYYSGTGAVSQKQMFRNDKPNGAYRNYNRSGKITGKSRYKDGHVVRSRKIQ